MKQIPKIQNCIASALVGLALMGATSLGVAADISYTFDTDVQGWYAADAHGSVVWDGTHNRGASGGCLKCTIVGGVDSEIDPRVDVAYNTMGYFSVEFDMMIDTTSGTDAVGTYGNLQTVDWDAAWTWHSMWYGTLGGPGGVFDGQWKHMTVPFSAAYGDRARLAFQIAAATAPYSSDVIIYIDNVIIRDGTPPNQAMLYSFDWPDQCVPDNFWGGQNPSVFSQDTTLSTSGCLKQVADYGDWGTTNTGWIDAPAEIHVPTFDPSKFTYIDFDLYLDAPAGTTSFGQYELHYWWSWAGIAAVPLSADNVGKWTHYSFPLPAGEVHGVVLHPGGNGLKGLMTYYLDNVTLWKPAAPPKITSHKKASSVGGVQISMSPGGGQWQREAIVTDPASAFPHFWDTAANPYPVSYSYTIADFPEATKHGGFEAHMYLVNGDTGGGATGWNATYGAVDWNVPDIFMFRVENNAAGGATVHVNWKTNLPNGNAADIPLYHPVNSNAPTAIGTWTLTFNDATTGVITGPGSFTTSFTLPIEVVTNNFKPISDYIQFGMFKNDGANDGHNNNVSGTFSNVKMLVNGYQYEFDDSFAGPELTTTYPWRKTTSSGGASAVQWCPPGLGYWLTWTLPDDGFSVQVSDTVTGPYTDAGVTYTYTVGASKTGGVPATSVPTGSKAFFRLMKPAAP